MEFNSKKLEQTTRIIYYSISAVLCIFLILLSSKIIGDLDNTVKSPVVEDFQNQKIVFVLQQKYDKDGALIDNLNSKKETITKTISAAEANYKNEKQSFDNWLQTRKTLGSPEKDQEVLARAKQLDEFYKVEQEWRVQSNIVQGQIDEIEKEKTKTQDAIDKENAKAEEKYNAAYKKYELKVFLVRLLFVAPILALGIFFFIRFRKNKFWPLYFGFTLFSLYAFFIGLVPYLPSYGGYVRSSVGIIVSIGLGYYAIKRIRLYSEQKQAELKVSTQERAKKLQSGVAAKALENHICPSCGKDFILKKWELVGYSNTEGNVSLLVTNYCRHCGLELFKSCSSCGTKNFAHLPFCSSCGTRMSVESKS